MDMHTAKANTVAGIVVAPIALLFFKVSDIHNGTQSKSLRDMQTTTKKTPTKTTNSKSA